MELIVKHFKELSKEELFEIYKLRVAVFVVEQNCPYQEIDDTDLVSYHVYLKEEDRIVAYLRAIPQGISFEDASLGRVIAVKRRCGLGTKIVKAGIEVVKEKFKTDKITIEAQVYAKSLDEKCGFKQVSEEFLEDNIPHIKMSNY